MQTTSEMMSNELTCATRWGLSSELVTGLGRRLHSFWQRYRERFVNRTRDPSQLAEVYLRAQLTLERDRNFAHIGRTFAGNDGQPLEHFMSQSPWSARAVLEQLQEEVSREVLVQTGSALILDECADEKAGLHSAGAARQYNGHLGKVDLCQVSVCLGYANIKAGLWTLVDGELFLPEAIFTKENRKLRAQQGLPTTRQFATKVELGWQMIQRAQANGLPFDVLACDSLYGRSAEFRRQLAGAQLCYAAQVPADTQVYRDEPEVGLPPQRGPGAKPKKLRVLSTELPREVRQVAADPLTPWQRVEIRQTERGLLAADFAVLPVWTVEPGEAARAEQLVLRREASGELTYTLCWAPEAVPTVEIIRRSCVRYFVERVFEDGKDGLGWAEFQGLKYQAWFHHLALTALALWFVAETKLDWQHLAPRDPHLAAQLEVELLPALSTANVRELLRAVLPLPSLSPEQAIELVIGHLLRRAASTRSRLKHQQPPASAP